MNENDVKESILSKMKKRTFSVLKTILCVVLCFACSNDNKETVEQLKAQVDSLQMANEQQANSMNDMMLFVKFGVLKPVPHG